MPRLAWLVLACLLLAGCAQFVEPTEQQRAQSFSPFDARIVGDEPLTAYLKKRTAFIVSGGITVAEADANGRTVALRFAQQPKRNLWLGLAAAVDRRGYFLTAAHCVSEPYFYLVYWDGKQVRVAAPRVVASTSGNGDDYALLRVDAELQDVFTWAPEGALHSGQDVVAIGTGPISIVQDAHASSYTTPLGGQVVAIVHNLQSLRLNNNVPLRPGDSGGPFATTDGHLLGINSGVHVSTSTGQVGFASRPAPEWVNRVIAYDRRHSPHDQSTAIASLADRGSAHLVLTLW